MKLSVESLTRSRNRRLVPSALTALNLLYAPSRRAREPSTHAACRASSSGGYLVFSTIFSALRTSSRPISPAHLMKTGRVFSRNALTSPGESVTTSMP